MPSECVPFGIFNLQIIGALFASVIWQWSGNWVERNLESVGHLRRGRSSWERIDAILSLIVVGILVWTVMPLDIVISPVELTSEFLKTEWVPFTRLESHFSENLYQWGASIVLAIPLGLWLSRNIATRFNGQFSSISIFLIAVVIGVLPEIAQIPIGSRVASATDAFFGVVGSLLGVFVGSQFQSTRFHAVKTDLKGVVLLPGFWFAVAAITALMTCAIAWMPFDFSTSGRELASRVKAIKSDPFVGTQGSDLLRGLTFFRQLVLAGILGIALAFGQQLLRLNFRYSILLGCVMVIGISMFSVFVEFGQLLANSRTGEALGVTIRLMGGALGFATTISCFRTNSVESPR